MIDVVVYISSVLNPNKHTRKVACLENFAEGVRQAGGTVHVEHSNLYKICRLAVILGWVSDNSQGYNIQLRRAIIQQQQQQGRQGQPQRRVTFRNQPPQPPPGRQRRFRGGSFKRKNTNGPS